MFAKAVRLFAGGVGSYTTPEMEMQSEVLIGSDCDFLLFVAEQLFSRSSSHATLDRCDTCTDRGMLPVCNLKFDGPSL